jgi:hypothetical protein
LGNAGIEFFQGELDIAADRDMGLLVLVDLSRINVDVNNTCVCRERLQFA